MFRSTGATVIREFRHIATISIVLALVGLTMAAVADEPKPVSPDHSENMARGLELFSQHVRGVLVTQCINCHGGEETESEFDLNTREGLLRGGENGKVIVEGNAAASRLYQLISHAEDPKMPMDASKLSDAQIAHIARWINHGAPYDKPLIDPAEKELSWTDRVISPDAKKFWAFQPLGRHEPPPLKSTSKSKSWCRTPIDQFIWAKLEEKGISPNPVDIKRNLIRRAYFDLVGLPPTPEAVEKFVNDPSADAYERLITDLLDNPHYGERWARHWLDAARFAESFGFEQDTDRPYAYHFRDFVIKALNQDMPYDQFVRWQLAGDEIRPEHPLAMMATGFLGAGVFPTQLTEKEYESARYDALDDMAATTGTAMLGMTIGCARCHDHKFDPIPQADYYRLVSTFTTTIRSNIDLEFPVEGWDEFQKQHAPLVAALEKYERDELPSKVQAWLAALKPDEPQPAKWRILDFREARSEKGSTFTRLDDGSLLATGENPTNDRYVFVAHAELKDIAAVRVEALADDSFEHGGPGRSESANFTLTDLKITAAPADEHGQAVAVQLVNPRATFQQNDHEHSVAGVIDEDPLHGWGISGVTGKDQAAAFDFATPVGFDGGTILTLTMLFNDSDQHSIGRPRIAISANSSPPLKGDARIQFSSSDLLKMVHDAGGLDKLNPNQREIVVERFRAQDVTWNDLNQVVQAHWKSRPRGEITKAMVCSEGVIPIAHLADGRGFPNFYPETYFLNRGDPAQKKGVARQGFIQVLMRAPDQEKHWTLDRPKKSRKSYRRRGLANWITDVKHGAGHLLARVIVNRLWQHHIGRGIVATPNDFGVQGQRPTHPELLDWLARRLIADEWQLKPIHELIMTSAVYMQSAQFDEADSRADPENSWCWRRQPRRLEAEIIRDSMLAISGELDRSMFGSGTLDQGMKRRSIYFMIKRSKLIPMMQIFDFPEPLVSVGNRPSTTIAPQALLFMNNPHVRGYACSLAQQLAPAADKSLAEAASQGYKVAVSREPTQVEINDTVAYLRHQIESYTTTGQPNPRHLALTDFCQVLMSLNEFIYVQ